VTYQKLLDKISSKYGISLELVCIGGKFVATFFIGAAIDVKGLDEQQKMEQVKLSLKGLKEALERIMKYEIDLEKRRIQQK